MSAIYEFIWGPTPSTSKERKLLRKIDLLVLPYLCINYWVNYLDRQNYSAAYVAGMQEDLHMVGDQFNIVNTVFTVAYTVFQVPHELILLKVKPRYWLSFCCFAWGMLTLALYKATSYRYICAVRFFQAVFEASTFSGTHFILGNWYKDSELTKRSAIFTSSGLVGSIFSGFMQSALAKESGNLKGWQKLFIVDFAITIPVAIYCFFFFPDLPQNANPRMFSDEEKQMAIDRLPPRPETKFDKSVFKRVFGTWKFWMFSALWAVGGENESYGINTLLSLWLKYFDYSISNRTNYPNGIYAVAIVSTLLTAMYVDYRGKSHYWHVALWITAVLLVSTILLLSKPLSSTCVFIAHYLSGVSYSGQAAYFSWANVVCHDDIQQRAITLGAMQMFSNAVNSWWSIVFYKATDVPKFRKGCYAMLGTIFASLFVAIGIHLMATKEDKKKQRLTGETQGVIDTEMGDAESEGPSKEKSVIKSSSISS